MQPIWNEGVAAALAGGALQSPAHRVLRVLQVTRAHWPMAAKAGKAGTSSARVEGRLRRMPWSFAEHA